MQNSRRTKFFVKTVKRRVEVRFSICTVYEKRLVLLVHRKKNSLFFRWSCRCKQIHREETFRGVVISPRNPTRNPSSPGPEESRGDFHLRGVGFRTLRNTRGRDLFNPDIRSSGEWTRTVFSS